MIDRLDWLENRSVYIFREAYAELQRCALLWSLGKDSNVMIALARKAFLGVLPFPVLHVDTGRKFPQMYAFRDHYAHEWDLDLLIEYCPDLESIDASLPPAARAAARKTAGLKQAIKRYDLTGLFAGIRRDEQATRAKERIFSPRLLDGRWQVNDQPPEMWDFYKSEIPDGAHLRIHPLLDWDERDIWMYTKREQLPVIDLYFASNGERYRSLGDRDITHPVASDAATLDAIIAELAVTSIPERAGRSMDHESENAFEILRRDGYL